MCTGAVCTVSNTEKVLDYPFLSQKSNSLYYTNLRAEDNTDVVPHHSGGQVCKTPVSPELSIFLNSLGEGLLPCRFQVFLASGVAWVVAAPPQSLLFLLLHVSVFPSVPH
jgi:hypothetical protein